MSRVFAVSESPPVPPQLSVDVEALLFGESDQVNYKACKDKLQHKNNAANIAEKCKQPAGFATSSTGKLTGFIRRLNVSSIDMRKFNMRTPDSADSNKENAKVSWSYACNGANKVVQTKTAASSKCCNVPAASQCNLNTNNSTFSVDRLEKKLEPDNVKISPNEQIMSANVNTGAMSLADVSSKPVSGHDCKNEKHKSKFPESFYIEVNKQNYAVNMELGRGGSSIVYEASKGKVLAIKCVDLKGTERSVHQAYLNEIGLLEKLQGSNRIIKLFDYEYKAHDEKLNIVIERGDIDLATLISLKGKTGDITPHMIKYYWEEMLRCVQEIHRVGIIHSDLKPANFLLVKGQLKLIDFGIACAIPDDKTSITKDIKCGTLNYMSPESIMEIQYEMDSKPNGNNTKIKIRTKSDVWSLGCILYHMVYGHTPFQHVKNQLKLQAIINPAFSIAFPPVDDKLLLDVLQKCVVRDYSERASVEDLLKHPYLSGCSCGVGCAIHA